MIIVKPFPHYYLFTFFEEMTINSWVCILLVLISLYIYMFDCTLAS